MGVKIVKGITGQYDALKSPSNQAAQSKSTVAKAAQAVTANGEAAVSLVRGGGRSEGAERLNLEKAEKLAKSLGERILGDEVTALGAVGDNFSISAVRDAFGV